MLSWVAGLETYTPTRGVLGADAKLAGRTADLTHGTVTSQDAYMPKDASKQSHRGIGFVTFANSDSVEAVMSTPHSLNGQELAIDRATPKDKVCLPASIAIELLTLSIPQQMSTF